MNEILLSELAKKYNVKKPTIYSRLIKLQKKNPDKKLLTKVNGLIYCTEVGQYYLEQDIKAKPLIRRGSYKIKASPQTTTKQPEENTKINSDTELALELKHQKELNKLLKSENKKLTEENERLIKQIENSQNQINGLINTIKDLNIEHRRQIQENYKIVEREQELNLANEANVSLAVQSVAPSKKKAGLFDYLKAFYKVTFSRN